MYDGLNGEKKKKKNVFDSIASRLGCNYIPDRLINAGGGAFKRRSLYIRSCTPRRARTFIYIICIRILYYTVLLFQPQLQYYVTYWSNEFVLNKRRRRGDVRIRTSYPLMGYILLRSFTYYVFRNVVLYGYILDGPT